MPLYRDLQVKFFTVQEALNQGSYREAVKRFIDAVGEEGAFEHTPPELQDRMLDNAKTLYELTSAERDPFTSKDAAAIQTPTLLIMGEKSAPFLHTIIEVFANYLPNKKCVIINGAGHPTHSQNPKVYNEAVLRFLESQA
jgi:pimeloyl-ACP methyl ester carboxylesterase